MVETYADVTGEVVKKRLRAARQPNKGCAVWQVPINMWEWVRECADEARQQHMQGQGERQPPQAPRAADRRRRTGHWKGGYKLYIVTKVLIGVSIRQPLIESW